MSSQACLLAAPCRGTARSTAGEPRKGQLGIGAIDSVSHGVTRVPGDLRFRSLRAGFNTVCGITDQADAFCWGAGDWAQLGNGRFGHSPVPVLVAGGLKFQAVSAGGHDNVRHSARW